MTQHTTAAAPAVPTDDGALLLEIYRRLVPLHAALTEHGARRPDVPRIVAADLMDVLGRIAASPAFRAAEAADREVQG